MTRQCRTSLVVDIDPGQTEAISMAIQPKVGMCRVCSNCLGGTKAYLLSVDEYAPSLGDSPPTPVLECRLLSHC